MARSFYLALNTPEMTGCHFNVGSNSMNISKQGICDIISHYTDLFVHNADVGSDADQRNYEVSYDKIFQFGFDTTVTLDEGVRELVNGIKVLDFYNPYINI
jgi:nucleoside-diphosphate-sugar epimerase